MDISIFIPIYKESNQLKGMLNVLNGQNVTKEIFVSVDEPTPKFSEEIGQLQNEHVKFIVNKERTGKANALNEAAKLASGKVLLFLDADVQVSDDPDFLKKNHDGNGDDRRFLTLKKKCQRANRSCQEWLITSTSRSTSAPGSRHVT